jgi:hypothetical protein
LRIRSNFDHHGFRGKKRSRDAIIALRVGCLIERGIIFFKTARIVPPRACASLTIEIDIRHSCSMGKYQRLATAATRGQRNGINASPPRLLDQMFA